MSVIYPSQNYQCSGITIRPHSFKYLLLMVNETILLDSTYITYDTVYEVMIFNSEHIRCTNPGLLITRLHQASKVLGKNYKFLIP